MTPTGDAVGPTLPSRLRWSGRYGGRHARLDSGWTWRGLRRDGASRRQSTRHQHWPLLRFPLATVVVNILGCCLFGLLAGAVASGRLPTSVYWRHFAFVGVIGGFTTFSTFGFETVTLVRAGASGQAAFNIALQLAGGIGGLYAGLLVAERVGPTIQ